MKLHCTRILAKHLLQYFLFPSNTQQLIQAREEEQKLSLAKICKLFHNWPLLSLKKISGLIKWRRFSPGQGSLSRWREETHIVSLFYIKFSYLFVDFLCGLVCSRWLFVRLDYVGGKRLPRFHLCTSLASWSTRNIFQHFLSDLILLVRFRWFFSCFSVLVSEGERCEVIGFIKKGECLRRRYINVACTLPNGKKVSVIKIPKPFPRYLFLIFNYIPWAYNSACIAMRT